MAYFEYGYVNTGYDEDSATEPEAEEYNAIVNIVYSTFDEIYEKSSDFKYNIGATETLEKIVDFRNNVYGDFFERIYDFAISFESASLGNIVEFGNDVNLSNPINSYLQIFYNVGEKDQDNLLVIRSSE